MIAFDTLFAAQSYVRNAADLGERATFVGWVDGYTHPATGRYVAGGWCVRTY
jgi:hypothetical protein